jgi:[protein-PII] uridylyltransferase
MSPTHHHNQTIANLKAEIHDTHLALRQMILHNRQMGIEVAGLLSQKIDSIIQIIFARHFNAINHKDIAIIAVGGYGRGLLAPFSDIDLCLVVTKMTNNIDNAIRSFLYDMWDLKLKLGYSTGTPEDIITSCQDMTKRTALLERRFLCGNIDIFNTLSEQFKILQDTTVFEFTKAKLTERNHRHQQTGQSRYLVEPDLKNSKGGLRDIHVMMWIGKYIYKTDNPQDFIEHGILSQKDLDLIQKSERLFWAIRFLLHLEIGRGHEKINFDVQKQLADMLGYRNAGGLSGVERFMRHYFLAARQVGTITRIFTLALEAKNYFPSNFKDTLKSLWQRFNFADSDFCLKDNRLCFKKHISLDINPEKAVSIFKFSDAYQIAIHPETMRFIRANVHHFNDNFRKLSEPYLIFREILCRAKNIESVLRQMSEVGLLGRLIPDFGKIICLMQFNMYHHYTVDEHLIRCVGIIHKIANGHLKTEHPLASDIINRLDMKDILFLSVFIHDMAKGRQEDHSEQGEEIINWLAPKMGFTQAETEIAKWLVLYHLRMSDVSQRRDLSDPVVYKDFAEFVLSSERLKLLLCLTVADIRGVGPGVWNGYKGELLRTLYNNTQEILQGGYISDNRTGRVESKKQDFIKTLETNEYAVVQPIINRLPDSFWLGTDIKTQMSCIHLIEKLSHQHKDTDIKITPDEFTAVTEIIIYTQDYSGLFTSLSGALATSGVTIYDAKLFTDNNGFALDIFRIQDIHGKAVTDKEHLKRIKKRVFETINQQKIDFSMEKQNIKTLSLSATRAVYTDMANVTVDNQGSNNATLIEVTAMNRNYLLYDIATTLYALRVSVASAHINTYGETAVDVFYIKNRFGLKITDTSFLAKIKQSILATISVV